LPTPGAKPASPPPHAHGASTTTAVARTVRMSDPFPHFLVGAAAVKYVSHARPLGTTPDGACGTVDL
jgi:hypothetical protein